MKKEYECCVPKEIKDEFFNNSIRKRAILQIMFGLSKSGGSDIEITKALLDQQAEIEKKEYHLWSQIISMYPELIPTNFTFNIMDFKVFYHEDEED